MPDGMVPAQGDTTPASVPVGITPEQIHEIISKGVSEAFDSRIPGLQSVFDKKVAALQSEFEKVRRSSMTDDELEDESNSTLKAELAAAQRRNAALQLAVENPGLGKTYLEFLDAESAEDQLKILARLTSQASQPAPADTGAPVEPETGTPPVDMNNPRREPSVFAEEQPFKTEEQALAFLDRIPWPGRG